MELGQLGAVLARLINIGEAELMSELKKTDSEDFKDQTDVERILEDHFKAKFQKIADNNSGRGKREALTSLEKTLRSEFDISSKLEGVDLVREIVSKREQAAAEKNQDPTLTPEQLKSNPIVQDLLKGWIEKHDSIKTEYEAFKESTIFEKHAGLVRSKIKDTFLSLNPILPTGEEKRVAAIESFVNAFNPNDFKVVESGDIIPLKNGEHLQDDRLNEVSFSQLITDRNWFNVHDQDPSKSSASPTPGGSGQSGTAFKSQQELMDFINDPKTTTEQALSAQEAFDKQQ